MAGDLAGGAVLWIRKSGGYPVAPHPELALLLATSVPPATQVCPPESAESGGRCEVDCPLPRTWPGREIRSEPALFIIRMVSQHLNSPLAVGTCVT